MAQKITRYLLITLILSLGFGQLLRFEISGVPIYLHDILIIALLSIHGLTLKSIKIPGSLKIFILGLALGWVNALFHYPFSQLLIPALYSLRLLAYLTLYLRLQTTNYQLPTTYFYISGFVTLAIGYLQYFLLPDMRIFQYLGWDDHLNRLTLPHFDPTYTGVMLSLTLLSYPLANSYIRYSILFIPAILLTYSRSVWLSLALTATFFIKNKKILLLAICCMLLAIFALPQKFGEGNNLLRTYTITSRWQSDWTYLQTYKWDLLIGRGFNTLMLNQSAGQYPNPALPAGRHATGPNNSYLYLLATTGILGLFGWGKFLWSLFRSSRYPQVILFFALASLFNNVMFYPFALLWILLVSFMVPTEA